jgi:hypothetical protein
MNRVVVHRRQVAEADAHPLVQPGHERRDERLRSADFLNVEAFPEMVFEGRSFEPFTETTGQVTGDLTLRGVTRPVALDVTFNKAGRYPFRNIMVGLKLGGQPITDYAPDFWLVGESADADPIGYVTSPWYAPELGTNIALAYVPVTHQAHGTRLKVWLPDEYAETAGVPVDAEVVQVPFRPSENPSAREVAVSHGRDFAY